MTLTTTVSRQYRSITDSILGVDWGRLAATYLAVYLATALWLVYIDFFAYSEQSTDTFSVSIGLENTLDTAVEGLVFGAVIAPLLFVAIAALTRVLPIRRVYAQTVVPWLLACPIGLVVFLGYVMFGGDLELGRVVFDSNPWMVAEWAFMWAVLSTLLVAFVGGAYALTTQSATLSRPRQRALVVAVVALLVIPVAVGAAVPVGDDSETDESVIDSSHGDELEDGAEPADDGDGGDGESILERLLDGRDATDPGTYDDGEYSPSPEHITSLEGESDTAAVSGVNESELPADRHVSEYPVAAYHTDAEGVHISDVEFEVDGDTVVPDARYHIEIDGVNTSSDRQPGMVPHWSYNATGESEYGAFVSSASAGLEDGYLLNMEQVESTFVYFDLVNDDGEIHRYVIEVERTDV